MLVNLYKVEDSTPYAQNVALESVIDAYSIPAASYQLRTYGRYWHFPDGAKDPILLMLSGGITC